MRLSLDIVISYYISYVSLFISTDVLAKNDHTVLKTPSPSTNVNTTPVSSNIRTTEYVIPSRNSSKTTKCFNYPTDIPTVPEPTSIPAKVPKAPEQSSNHDVTPGLISTALSDINNLSVTESDDTITMKVREMMNMM